MGLELLVCSLWWRLSLSLRLPVFCGLGLGGLGGLCRRVLEVALSCQVCLGCVGGG